MNNPALRNIPLTSRICTKCGREYDAKRWWQEFCSQKCRTAWHIENRGDELENCRREIADLKRQVAELLERVKNGA